MVLLFRVQGTFFSKRNKRRSGLWAEMFGVQRHNAKSRWFVFYTLKWFKEYWRLLLPLLFSRLASSWRTQMKSSIQQHVCFQALTLRWCRWFGIKPSRFRETSHETRLIIEQSFQFIETSAAGDGTYCAGASPSAVVGFNEHESVLQEYLRRLLEHV